MRNLGGKENLPDAFYRIAARKEMLIPAHVQFMDSARLICIKRLASLSLGKQKSMNAKDSFQYLLFNTRLTGALEGCAKKIESMNAKDAKDTKENKK